MRRDVTRRLTFSGVALCVLVCTAASLYHYFGHGRWTWFDCLYMTVITLSTVGFGETLAGLEEVPGARLFTLLLIVLGSGLLLYVASSVTALIVEGDLRGALNRRRMERIIAELRNHIIVCGAGRVGGRVIEELSAAGTPFVAIEGDAKALARVEAELGHPFPHFCGDATEDALLLRAGLEHARGVVCTLSDDRDNLYITLSARALAPKARIVARAIALDAAPKMRRAGADSVVSPNAIGGHRLASEMIRPTAVAFLDHLLRDSASSLRIDEIYLGPGSSLLGKSLSEAKIREQGGLVLAYRDEQGHFVANPPEDYVIGERHTLVVMAEQEAMVSLQAIGGAA